MMHTTLQTVKLAVCYPPKDDSDPDPKGRAMRLDTYNLSIVHPSNEAGRMDELRTRPQERTMTVG